MQLRLRSTCHRWFLTTTPYPGMPLARHLNGLHHRTTIVKWLRCNLHCGRPSHQRTTPYSILHQHRCEGTSQPIHCTHLLSPWLTTDDHLQLRPSVLHTILETPLWSPWNRTTTLNGLSRTTQQPNRMNECHHGTVSPSTCQLPTG
jgi:hypothetical protein